MVRPLHLVVFLSFFCVSQAVLNDFYLEAEYYTSAGSWSASTSSNIDSCGWYISTGTSGGTAVSYNSFIVPATGTYKIWALSRWTYSSSYWSSAMAFSFDGGAAINWDVTIPGWQWRSVGTVYLTAGAHTMTIKNRKYPNNFYLDKIRFSDVNATQMASTEKGARAINVPAGKCQEGFFEPEFGDLAGLTLQPSSDASLEGAVYRSDTTTYPCSGSARNSRFTYVWSETVYRPVWARVLAPSSSSNQIMISSASCGNGVTLTVSPTGPEYQWAKFPSPVYLTSPWYLTLISGGIWVDKIYVGWNVPVDAQASNIPTTGTSCTVANGLCDPVTTCSTGPVCSACPFGYNGCGDIKTCAYPDGCQRLVPYGCHMKRSEAVWAATPTAVSFPTGAMTVEMWLSLSLGMSTSVDSTLFHYCSGTGCSSEFKILYNPVSTVGLYVSYGGSVLTPSPRILLNQDIWYHLAVTKDGTTIKIYVNLALKATFTTSATLNTPGLISLGRKSENYESIAGNPMCSVDELRIWNAALDAATLGLYDDATLTTTKPNLVHVWSFGPDSGLNCPQVSTETFGSGKIEIYSSELQALTRLFWTTGGLNWNAKGSWLVGSPCNGDKPVWFGVDCSSNRIITLDLAYNNLVGTLPPIFFAPFTQLKILFLDHNSLSGVIPDDIRYLTRAVTILLNDNQFTSMPTTLGSLTVLSKLYLQNNLITSVPEVFATMTSLTYLYLANNKITSIPTTVASSNIKYLDLSGNLITGTVPQVVMDSSVDYMDFSNNQLSGKLTNRTTTANSGMISIDLSGNFFTCKIAPFTKRPHQTFPVLLGGSIFFCPTNDVVPQVTGFACESVTISSITPNSYDISTGFHGSTAVITATGLRSCSGVRVYVPGVGLITPTLITGTTVTFVIPERSFGIVAVKLMWSGDYDDNSVLSTNSVDFKYYIPCPASCVSPYGVCSGLSGVCRCNGTRGGPDCHQLACPANCNGRGDCDYETGTCNCHPPYFGQSCSAALIPCPMNCSGNGECDIFVGTCSCYLGYWGADCSNKTCPPHNVPFCGHGTCNGTSGKCICDSGWIGDSCITAVKTCPGDCTNKNQGQCNQFTGVCTCFEYMGLKYGGPDCSQVVCIPACVNGGTCNISSSTCVCPLHYYGSDCSTPRFECPNNCTSLSQGDCNTRTGNCSCRSGFKGDDCSIHICPGTPECSYPNGTCNTATGACICTNNTETTSEYWSGYMCQYKNYVCPGNPPCSGKGYCDPRTGVCMCNYPFDVDSTCSTARCPNNCWYHGDCDTATGKCSCSPEYNTTVDCQFLYLPCSSPCNHGYCDTRTGSCVCTSPWTDYGADKCSYKLCTNDCNSNGVCNNGTCICNGGWTGLSCGVANKSCSSNCNDPAGRCDTTTGECVCYGTSYGPNCEYKKCLGADLGLNCSGHGSCDPISGSCTCDPGWEPPDCYVNLCSLLDFCTSNVRGKCDTTDGSCVCNSPYFGTSCEYKGCPLNCSDHGTCDTEKGECTCDLDWIGTGCEIFSAVCPPSRAFECSGNGLCDHLTGFCTCTPGYFGDDCSQIYCPNNCSNHGTCNYTTGTCLCDSDYMDPYDIACTTPYLLCDDDTCSGNGFCRHEEGLCYCYTGFHGDICQYKYCPSKCNLHGTCDNTTGICICQPYWNGTACLEPIHTCPNNCTGSHGTCDKTTGNCTCKSPYLAPDCLHAQCSLNCSYPNGICDTTVGVCQCTSSWTGKGCQIANFTCDPPCVYGRCDATTGKCICQGGSFGDACESKQCQGKTPCSGHGDCDLSNGVCTCWANYTGSSCQIANASCPKNCTSEERGVCNKQTGVCSCRGMYTGDDCGYMKCPSDCKGHGVCNNLTGVCTCWTNYTGNACEIPNAPCPNNCTSEERGLCNKQTGVCSCRGMYTGDDCGYIKCPSDCKGHGDCNPNTGVCTCWSNYTGNACEVPNIPCPNNCTSADRGFCNTQAGVCLCRGLYTGKDCGYIKCPSNCRDHGVCNNLTGVCQCDEPYLLPDCFYMSCPNNCSGHGTCNPRTGICTCNRTVEDWGGLDCLTLLCPLNCSGAGECQPDGTCNCKVGTTGEGCDGENWWVIVVCTVCGAGAVVGGSIAGFAAIRQYRISSFKNKQSTSAKKYVDMPGLKK